MQQRILALDISTKTGWSVIISGPDGYVLESYGQIPQISQPDGTYPGVYVDWAYLCYREVVSLVDQHAPDFLVIEETSAGSKAIYTQKILEFIHFLVARMIRDARIPVRYMMTEEWRRIVGCKMSKSESKHNKAVRDYKKKKKTKVAYNESGKRVGVIGRKHVNVRVANEYFKDFLSEPLRMKDEDAADSLLLGLAHHITRTKPKPDWRQ